MLRFLQFLSRLRYWEESGSVNLREALNRSGPRRPFKLERVALQELVFVPLAGKRPGMNGQPTPRKDHPQLLRRFGLLQATALNMTNMIGIGPFITIPALMSALHGPQAMLGWVVAVLITVPDALVWSELGAAMPGSGGSYVYLRDGFGRETFGRLMAFLFA